MTGGAVVIWIAVIALAIYAFRARPGSHRGRRANYLIIGGGAIVPTVVLTVLLVYGLAPIPELLAPAPEGSLKIAVSGEQWWWRVRYRHCGRRGGRAGERDPPAGRRAGGVSPGKPRCHSLLLDSFARRQDRHDPGSREPACRWTPTRTGVFRGVCAEYCGTSHALMSFYVVVMEKEQTSTAGSRQQRSRHSRQRSRSRAARTGAVPRQRLRRVPHGPRHAGRRRGRPGPDPRGQPPEPRRRHPAQ